MPKKSFAQPAGSEGVTPLGGRSLSDLVGKFLPHVYTTTHKLRTADITHRPTSVSVFGITGTKKGTAGDLSTPLNNLSLADLIALLSKFTFQVDTHLHGTKIKGDGYRIDGNAPNPGTKLPNGNSFVTKFDKLSLKDVVDLLPQATFKVSNGSAGGQSETYTVSGAVENDVETNPDLSVPVGGLTPKYVLLLKRFFRFTVAPTNPGQGVSVAMFHNKTLVE
jgi:hypothetical protein